MLKACLTKGSFAGCHTRWRGLESHLLRTSLTGCEMPYSKVVTLYCVRTMIKLVIYPFCKETKSLSKDFSSFPSF